MCLLQQEDEYRYITESHLSFEIEYRVTDLKLARNGYEEVYQWHG
jgi:hypothetical protein